ncbi:hypothetical protein B0E53_00773 [Micromonospora sp. MH33]|nr:hypothetical protein B0E53_00773 [Micromonospora sp. MH33]
MLGTGAVATAGVIGGVPATHAEADRHRALVDTLGALGVRQVRGGYWTCNRLIFNTGEAVVCAVLDGDLSPGQNRYPAYWKRVGRAARPGYVLAVGSSAERGLRRLLGDRADAAVVAEVGGYRVYHPDAAVRPWR